MFTLLHCENKIELNTFYLFRPSFHHGESCNSYHSFRYLSIYLCSFSICLTRSLPILSVSQSLLAFNGNSFKHTIYCMRACDFISNLVYPIRSSPSFPYCTLGRQDPNGMIKRQKEVEGKTHQTYIAIIEKTRVYLQSPQHKFCLQTNIHFIHSLVAMVVCVCAFVWKTPSKLGVLRQLSLSPSLLLLLLVSTLLRRIVPLPLHFHQNSVSHSHYRTVPLYSDLCPMYSIAKHTCQLECKYTL